MSLFSKKLGIDLGTATTIVYVAGRAVVLNEPSVVAVSLEDSKILAVVGAGHENELAGLVKESLRKGTTYSFSFG